MQLNCEVCRSPLRAEDVRLDIAVARCHACNAVYDLSGRKARGLDVPASRLKLQRAKAALPSRFEVEDDGTTARISWRWFTLKTLGLAAFCVFWDGFLVVWYGSTLRSPNTPTTAMLFSLLHVAAGVWITYTVLTGFFNHTRIEVNRALLTIRHSPLPWAGNRVLPGRSLAQLYGEEVVSRSRNGTSITYNLVALDREGRKVKLLTGLEEKDQVLWLEQTLERRLGIEDVPVDGELATRTQVA